jgi:two-component system, LytTR family, response regulator
MTAPLRTLIVDDEAPARELLRRFCDGDAGLEVVAECEHGEQAVTALRATGIDLVFLDIEMRRVSGLDVIRAVTPQRMPLTIFVTAHPRYAVDAFDVEAVDFLLKPYSAERFAAAVARARARLTSGADGGGLAAWRNALHTALREESQAATRRQTIAVEHGSRFRMLDVAEIEVIEAAGNYIVLQTRSEEFVLRRRIRDTAEWLDAARFLRVHRSRLVNLTAVREILPSGNGDFVILMASGRRVETGRSFRADVVTWLRGGVAAPARRPEP